MRELLQAVSRYPVSSAKLNEVALKRGLSLDAKADAIMVKSSGYQLATADLLVWLSSAPNISQGGQSYSFTSEERKELKRRAEAIYASEGEETGETVYGYKGQYL